MEGRGQVLSCSGSRIAFCGNGNEPYAWNFLIIWQLLVSEEGLCSVKLLSQLGSQVI
jgi:hypothetical protein